MNNNNLKKGLSLILAIAMICSIFVTIVIPTQAADAYVYNWGTREVDCTQLSTAAIGFYTGSYTFEQMSKLEGGSSQSNAPGSALYSALQTLMKSKHTYVNGYSANNDLLKYTDCQNGGGKISSFYSGKAIGPGWGEGESWNKEHTWPNSKGLGGSDEDDIMMIRPTATSENSSRGNDAYGESSGYYNPNSESGGKYDLRGDVARIFLYVYVRWGNTNGNGSYSTWGTRGVMESLDVLLKWMEADPVDTWEMGRNDSVQSITGTRNVFVDYPEYAWLLFGRNVPADYVSPSDNKGTQANPGAGTGSGDSGNSGTTTPSVDPVKPVVGTAYKLAMNQTAAGSIVYMKEGYVSTYYIATTATRSEGLDFYIEQASGGYNIYTTISGAKQYVNLVVSGTHVNAKYENSASTVYTWNESQKTLTASVNGAEYGLGTRNDKTYTTVGGVATAQNPFMVQFVLANESSGGTGSDNTGTGNTGNTGNSGSGSGSGSTVSEKVTYTFSEYTAGEQYAKNETHVLDDVMTVVTDDAHFTTQIRLYHTENAQYGSHHGTAVFKSTRAIKGLAVNAGNKADVLKVSGSNDGNTWTAIQEITVSTSYADYTVNMNGAEYTYIKLEATSAQIRVASVSVEYVVTTTPDGGEQETETDTETNTEVNSGNGEGNTETEENTSDEVEIENTETEEFSKENTEAETSGGQNSEFETSDELETSYNSSAQVAPGCGSTLGGSFAVIISLSLAGVMLIRKKKED